MDITENGEMQLVKIENSTFKSGYITLKIDAKYFQTL